MPSTIILYAPGSGGNHYKNMLCLDKKFVNHSDLRADIYDKENSPIGEVNCVAGRNLYPDLIDRIVGSSCDEFVIQAHFGELAQYSQQIKSIKEKKFLVITIKDDIDRRLLQSRQQRLGQNIHPYWLEEELPFLYCAEMCKSYYGAREESIFEISLYDAWNPDLSKSQIINQINRALFLNIPLESAQSLHTKWWELNFQYSFTHWIRTIYCQN
jgi:hypothetical protein